MNNFNEREYNPDILTCLANLSNDEVFTPPKIVNQMLDMLPDEIWHDSKVTFLDPVCKSGVFLREIAKRLIEGLKEEIPDLQERIDHIFHKQIYGIAITELTSLISRRSLYCSKYPNSKYSLSRFENIEGNIRYKRIEHQWKNDKCIFCGAPKSVYNRGKDLETYAYEWIHTNEVEKIFNMRFDVIIGNPPYQLSDGGNGKSATPIYQHFIEKAKKLKPRYLVMIIPSRWYTGGKKLKKFRQTMLSDKHIRKLVDYENFKDVFPGVDLAGGVCYFLWDRDNPGICEITNFNKDEPSIMNRFLDEYNIFIRQNYAVNIVKKITSRYQLFLNQRVSSRKPFGLPTNYIPQESGILCWFIQKIGLKYALAKDVDDSKGYLSKWKLLVPKAPIAGQTDFSKPVRFYYDGNIRIAKPGECCTESWIIAGAFNSEEEVLSYKSYIFTKIVRFLLLQTVVSQDVTRKNYCFIPDLKYYTKKYSDEILCKLWDISKEEWIYINSRITDTGENENGK
ncbi:Eco57I restriction-modification methylase domain-containing protein [Megamonas hypermegale]|uniref:Eco57I restriction-modification methylase domain-containing protein n=1 Tax=Megamonas hypermegale TaxID=158847 RepID=UPI0032095192